MDPSHHRHRYPPSPFDATTGGRYASPLPHLQQSPHHPLVPPPFLSPLPPPPPPPQQHHHLREHHHQQREHHPPYQNHNHHHHQPHPDDDYLYFPQPVLPDGRRGFLSEAANPRDLNMEKVMLYGSPHPQMPHPQRVSSRIVFPEGHTHARAAPRRPPGRGVLVRETWRTDGSGESAVVRVRVLDDGRAPFRREEADGELIRRGPYASHHREVLPNYHPMSVEGGGEIIVRKRQRREQDCTFQEDDASLLKLEGYDGRSQRRAEFWGTNHGGRLCRDTPPFEREPSEASSAGLPRFSFVPDRHEEAAPLVCAKMPSPRNSLDGLETLESSRRSGSISDLHDLDSRADFREKQFIAKGKMVYGGENSQDFSPRKPSVLSRIQYRNPVWDRLEEPKLRPSPAHVNSSEFLDQDRMENSTELDVSFKSKALVAKEVLVPPAGGALNIGGRNNAGETPKKEIPKSSSISPQSSGKASTAGLPKKMYSSNTESGEKPIPVTTLKKRDVEGTLHSPRNHTSKFDGKSVILGHPKKELVNTSKFDGKNVILGPPKKELGNNVDSKEISVPPIADLAKPGRSTTDGSLKEVSRDGSNEKILTSEGAVKLKVLKKVPGSRGNTTIKSVVRKVNAADILKDGNGNISPVGTAKKKVVRRIVVPRGTSIPKSDGKGTAIGISAKEVAKKISDGTSDGQTAQKEIVKVKVANEKLISDVSSIPEAGEVVASIDTSKKELVSESSKIAKAASNKKTEDSPSTSTSNAYQESASIHNSKEIITEDSNKLNSNGSFFLNKKEVAEETLVLPGTVIPYSGGDAAINSTSKEQVVREIMMLPASGRSCRNVITGEDPMSEGNLVISSTSVPNINVMVPIAGNTTGEAPKETMAGNLMTNSTCVEKLPKEIPLSGSSAINSDGNVSCAVGPPNKRKRKKKVKISSPTLMVSPSHCPTDKSLETTLTVNSDKDFVHAEGTQTLPCKKRRKKKKEVVDSIVSDIPCPAEDACQSGVSISSQRSHVYSEENCEASVSTGHDKHQFQLKECHGALLHPSDQEESRICKSPTSSHFHTLGHLTVSEGEVISDLGNIGTDSSSSQLNLKGHSLQNSAEKTSAEYYTQKDIPAEVEDVSHCCPLGDIGREDMMLGEEDKDGELNMISFVSVSRSSAQLALPVEAVIPYRADDMVKGAREGTQERVPQVCIPPSLEAGAVFDVEKPIGHVSTSLSSNSVDHLVLYDTGRRFAERDQEASLEAGSSVKVVVSNVENFNDNGGVEHEIINQNDQKMQKKPVRFSLEAQESASNHTFTIHYEKDSDDLSLLVKNNLPLPDSFRLDTNAKSNHSSSAILPDLNVQRLESKIQEQLQNIQIEQLSEVHNHGNITSNPDVDFIKKPISNSNTSSISSLIVGVHPNKTVLSEPLILEKKTPKISQKAKMQMVGGSLVSATGSAQIKDGQKTQKFGNPTVFPSRAIFPAKPPAKVAPGQNVRHRTWHRTDSSSVSQIPGPIKIPSTSSLRQSPKKLGRPQGSYVRKGNSLIRNSSAVLPQPRASLGLNTSLQAVDLEVSSTRTSEARDDVSDQGDYFKSGLNASIERPKTPPLPISSKLEKCTANLLPHPSSNDPLPEAVGEIQIKSCKSPNSELSIPKNSNISNTEQSNLNNSKRIIYVKHKSNQLVATTGLDNSMLHSRVTEKAQGLPSLSSDFYYVRKKNQLIRDTSSLDSHKVQDTLVPGDTSKAQSQIASCMISSRHGKGVPDKRRAHKDLAGTGKKAKQSKFSLVWRLNSTQECDGASLREHKVLPYIFPWKRATYWRTSAINFSKKRSLPLISKKLRLSRKRDTIYAISKGGFTLRKAGVRSIGGHNLKWSKSIERHSKKANEEATLAVAEVERIKRELKGASHLDVGTENKKCLSSKSAADTDLLPGERIFRVGNVRYKMDSSRRTLVRISGEDSLSTSINGSRRSSLTSFIPRRLLIGHDEYIRIGNGNKLIRDPKKLVRILASEKVRWSLHTARLRLAKKQQYCQFFTRFGKCNKEGKKCPYIHDQTKVAICTKFLKGLCSGTNCSLTHKIIPERMPDCSYYLLGHCTNATCPYRHVNVNLSASVCEGFLKGYCSNGDECRKKHTYACPDFEATGKCLQGSACKLHHPKRGDKSRKRKRSDNKTHSKERYFGSGVAVVSRPHIPSSDRPSKSRSEIFSEGQIAEFISLDVDSDEDSADKSDLMNSLPNQLDPNLSDCQPYSLDDLIKPFRIMNRKELNNTNAS